MGSVLQTQSHANSLTRWVSLGLFHQESSPYRVGGPTPESGSVPTRTLLP